MRRHADSVSGHHNLGITLFVVKWHHAKGENLKNVIWLPISSKMHEHSQNSHVLEKKVKSFYVVASKEVRFNSVDFRGFRGIPEFTKDLTLFFPMVSFDPPENVMHHFCSLISSQVSVCFHERHNKYEYL